MTTILIWDSSDPPPESHNSAQTIAFWCSYDTHGFANAVSIPQWVEDHADSLRQRYLAWIYEIGETKIHGKRVVDHLALRPGFSAWWMSLLAEKCNFAKSPQIDDAIKLMAFVDWMNGRTADHVVLVSAQDALAECLLHWCKQRQMDFKHHLSARKTSTISGVRGIYAGLPHPIRALIWIAYQVPSRWSLRGVGLQAWQQSKGGITFISYSDNLVPDAVTMGIFESRYWGHLPETLQRENIKTNWLHLYVKDSVLPTAKAVVDQVRRFNQTGEGLQNHVILDSFLSVAVLGQALRDWLRLLRKGLSLRMQKHMPKLGELNLWPLFQNDWKNSVIGKTALSNMLILNLFDAAFRNTPHQLLGVYLQENMDWEYAAIHAWKANKHEQIIGCPHSSIRYWDLRYYCDPRNYRSRKSNGIPLPDKVALNGTAALEAYRKGGYPNETLTEVEALRYLHLAKSQHKEKSKPTLSTTPLRILILGSYLSSDTIQQMRLLETAMPFLSKDTITIVKPHPNCPIHPADYPNIKMDVTMEPISKLLTQCDVAYTGSLTSSAIDAHCSGIPVISTLDAKTLNLNPLRNRLGYIPCDTSDKLVMALTSIKFVNSLTKPQQDFFTVDTKLPRWRKLLTELAIP